MSALGLELEGRTAVVTGAANGLGRAVALLFAEAGARLVLVDWDEGVEGVAGQCRDRGNIATAVVGDASEPETAERSLTEAGELDVLVNNAAIDPLAATSIVGTTVEDFDRVMRVNVRSTFVFARAAVTAMVERGRGGVIVNVASISGLLANPNEAAYSTSKSAIVGLTRCIAFDHAHQGIRANCVCPGVMEAVMVDRRRDMTADQLAARAASERGAPLGRAGTYEEIARSVLFLASDASSYTTGTTLVADGGMIAGYSGHGQTLWSLDETEGRA